MGWRTNCTLGGRKGNRMVGKFVIVLSIQLALVGSALALPCGMPSSALKVFELIQQRDNALFQQTLSHHVNER